MAPLQLEKRVAKFEQELADLESRRERPSASGIPWWDRIAGTFANDPAHDEAMNLGQR
jgi:hypothetical protein